MNRYKIVCLILGLGLLTALIRVVMLSGERQSLPDPKEVVINNIFQRKSVRSYTAQPISRGQLDTLARVGMAAPTGKDMRPWCFILVDDAEAIKKVHKALPRQEMLAQAKALIVVCGDLSVTDDKGKPSRNWPLDCSAATENILLAAESMGLGAVWLGVYPYEDRIPEVSKALGIPENVIPLNVISLGYPKGNPQPKDKYDKSNIHYNEW